MIFKLILTFLKIGFFAFGGGWAVVGILKYEMIEKGILSAEEFSQAISIAQMTPGPVAINLATYTGYRYYGFTGALLNTIAFLLAPIVIIAVIFYLSGRIKINKNKWSSSLMGVTTVMVLVTVYSLISPNIKDLWTLLIASFTFFCINKLKIHPLILIFACGLIGSFVYGML